MTPVSFNSFCKASAVEFGKQTSVDADDIADCDGWTSFIESRFDKLNG
jgi:hypothetical protein